MLQIIVPIILLVLVILCLRVFKYPGIAATLVWSMIVLESVVQQGNSFLLENATFMNFGIAAVAGGAAVWAILNRKYRKTHIPAQVLIYAALILMCALSYFWSKSPDDTLAQLTKNLPYIIAFGFLAPMCVFDEKQLDIAIKVLIYFGALIVIGINVSETGYRGILLVNEGGTKIEANPLAAASFSGYVAFACLFSIWGKKLFSPLSFLKIAIIGLCIIAMIRSGSRGQLLAFAMVAIVFFPIVAKAAAKRSTILAMLAAIGLTLFGVFMIDQLGWAKRWDYQRLLDDHMGRMELLQTLLEINLREGPIAWLFGLGSSASFKYIGGYPHNTIGETLGEEGVVGLLLLLTILYLCFRQGLVMMTSDALSMKTRVNVATLMAMFTFNCILSLKEGSLLGSAISIFSTGLTLAWLYSRLHREAKRKSIQVRMVEPSGSGYAVPRRGIPDPGNRG